ncbi:hypothetical protein PYCCODRAFT_1371779 [Trametes coccinea BRFM310]|uniref:Uncharacterized protein n=1 Tax=Trametes coccinea (strain BRFM310) TaxID=1353009 RepID=A0A1Y2IJR1_TRAC3|nr:hypothetical protein PYCCODRAFT_1371779 [Trametes coccinea BRFM310]
MSSIFLLPETSVTRSIALLSVKELSNVVVSLSGALDKDVEMLRETLQLPRDSARWTIALAARLSCHERVFQECIRTEVEFHREALYAMYCGDESSNGDLLHDMSAAVVGVHQSFARLNALFDGYAPHLDAAERAQIQDAHPALLREFKMLQTDDSAIQHDFTEWRGCFRVFLGDQTLDVYDTLLQTRRFSDPRLFFHELASPFQLLTEYLKKRQEIREKCVEMCDNDISSLLSRSGDCIPTAELRSQLRRYEDLGQLVLAGSVRQSEAIRSIEMLVQDANLHASVLFAAPDDRISLEKMHDTFRRYDDLRVMCSRVVERSAQLLDAMAPHIVTLEKARDWL